MKRKLLKITLEYKDTIETLEGKQAQDWIDRLNGTLMMHIVHGGQDFSEFKWKVVNK